MHRLCTVLGIGVFSVSIGLHAEQTSHEHGVADLMLVSDDDSIHFRLESPAMNIVGFEHNPMTKVQEKSLEQALKKLSKPETLMSFNGGQCRFISVDLENPFDTDGHHSDHKHDAHDHDVHASEDTDMVSEHREFIVEYRAQCKKLNELKSIHFSLLNEIKGIEKLQVQYILSGKQGALNLNSRSSRLDIPE